MIKIYFTTKSEKIEKIAYALYCIGAETEIISEKSAIFKLPENYYKIISHSLEFWGNFYSV